MAWQQAGDWYRFWFDGTEGTWCHAGYTAPDGGAVTQIVVNTAVREGPDAAAPQFGTAGAGQKYAVVETSGTWLRIQFAGDTGWIASADTTTPLAEPPPSEPAPGTGAGPGPGEEPAPEPSADNGSSGRSETAAAGPAPVASPAGGGGGGGNALGVGGCYAAGGTSGAALALLAVVCMLAAACREW